MRYLFSMVLSLNFFFIFFTSSFRVGYCTDTTATPPLQSPITQVSATINTDPPGATVSIDNGKFKGTSPITLQLAIGSHEVEVTKSGFKTKKETISVEEEGQEIHIVLDPKLVPFTIVTDPAGASISIDKGKFTGTGPAMFQLPVGSHKVEVTKAGHNPKVEELTVSEGMAQPILTVKLEPAQVTIHIITEPAGANISIDDGNFTGTAPGDFQVSIGSHDLEVSKEGYDTKKQAIDVTEEGGQFNITLEPTVVTVTINTKPTGASVSIDNGKFTGTSPVEFQLTPGGHEVEATVPGYKTKKAPVRVEKTGQHISITLDPILVQLTVTTDPPGAAVTIDKGKFSGTSPSTFDLFVGSHKVSATKSYYKPSGTTVQLSEDQETTGKKVHLNLTANLVGQWIGTATYTAPSKIDLRIMSQTGTDIQGRMIAFVKTPSGVSKGKSFTVTGKLDPGTNKVTFSTQPASEPESGSYQGTLSLDLKSITGTWSSSSGSQSGDWSASRQ